MIKNENAQKMAVQLQLIQKEMEQIQEQGQAIQNKIMELNNLKLSLSELPKSSKSATTWSQIGMGTYVQSKLADVSEVLVGVGANVFVKKNIPDATKTIDGQIELSQKYLARMSSNMQALAMQAQAMETQLNKID